MPFSEKIKQRVKERAHFKCCLCHKQWATHVHHIVPESEGGPDTEENAAPLCPTCHFENGNNPDMRNFTRQNRDFWYKFCEKASPPDMEMIREMHVHLCKEVVTKTDLDNALKPIYRILSQNLSPSEQHQQISDASAALSAAINTPSLVFCPYCKELLHDEDMRIVCTNCGWSQTKCGWSESGWH
jgi:hypothetical protein